MVIRFMQGESKTRDYQKKVQNFESLLQQDSCFMEIKCRFVKQQGFHL